MPVEPSPSLVYNWGMDVKERIEYLIKEIRRHERLYYVDATPEISDREFDALFDELKLLEEQNPELIDENSPTKKVGSDIDNSFPEYKHSIPVLSLDKVYDLESLDKWMEKVAEKSGEEISFTIEEKLDGASIVLYYKNGALSSAVTRGNGVVGNDVTDNVRTIKQIPLTVEEQGDFAVRGEIYIEKGDFEKFNSNFDNKYSNPRNLAAGSLRNIKSSVVATVPLKLGVYEGFFDGHMRSHVENLEYLKKLGFPVGDSTGYFAEKSSSSSLYKGDFSSVDSWINASMEGREKLNYEIDGLVIKVNEYDIRETLGYTSHHPRWAVALKFESPEAVTVLKDVVIQIGRNGRVTPVAQLEPVSLAGSVVSRATLHNQEYIETLELGRGDTVTISKRGDVIPAVEKVLEKAEENPELYNFEKVCPFCESELEKDGAHHFCKNTECPERMRRRLAFFVGRNQMDMDTLGGKTLAFLFDNGFVRDIADLYTFDYDRLLGEEGFKEKKIANIKEAVEKSRQQPFSRLLVSLGFEGIGAKAVKDLMNNGYNSFEKIVALADKGDADALVEIDGIGGTIAELIIGHFSDEGNLKLIKRLEEAGFVLEEDVVLPEGTLFEGQVWVITGSFENFKPRSKAGEIVVEEGGKVTGSVTGKTTHLLAGEKAGSKLEKAEKLGITVVNEEEFMKMLEERK